MGRSLSTLRFEKVKNPIRVAKRHAKKSAKNPYSVVGEQLSRHRQREDKTQWELAILISELLDIEEILKRHLEPALDASNPYEDAIAHLQHLQTLVAKISRAVSQMREQFDQIDKSWVSETVAQLLNVEAQIGRKVESARRGLSLSQDDLSKLIAEILIDIGVSGPPGRAGISKVERGERRLDLIEAWAAAIALKIGIEDLLPLHFAEMMPRREDLMAGWRSQSVWGNCRTYLNESGSGVLTIAAPLDIEIPQSVFAYALLPS